MMSLIKSDADISHIVVDPGEEDKKREKKSFSLMEIQMVGCLVNFLIGQEKLIKYLG